MRLLKSTVQSLINTGWYALHPKEWYALSRKAGALTLTDQAGWQFLDSGVTYAGKSVNEKTLIQMAATWSVIRLISETVGTLPIHLYEHTDKGRKKARDHYLYRMIHTQPNRFMTSVTLRESMTVSLCCWGHAYCKAPRVGERIAGIVPVPKPAINARVNERGEPEYKITEKGQQKPIDYDELLSVRGFGGTGELEGYAPWQMHRQSLAIGAVAEEFAGRYFSNGAKPSGLLMVDKDANKTQRKQIQENYEPQLTGAENHNRLLVLPSFMKYMQLSNNAADAQLNETKLSYIKDVARIWRVPLDLLMESVGETFNNSEQRNLHFLKYTLRAYLVRIEQALNTQLLTREEQKRYYFEFDVQGLLRGDSVSRSEYYRNMRMIGGITINEMRAFENLPPVEGGDDVHVPLNMAPADLLRESFGDKDGKN